MMLTRTRTFRTLTVLTVLAVGGLALTAASNPARSGGPEDLWLKNLDGKYGQFFDATAPGGGIPLIHVLNYYDTYNSAYGVADKDIDAVLTFYGMTTFYSVNDAMWAKYALGEFLDVKNEAGEGVTANPWRSNPTIIGMQLPQASIEALQKRGATFIVCNNALTIFAGMVAQKRGLDGDAVYADLKANILPGVELIPGMVIAVEQAQDAGLAYHRQ